MDYDAFCGERIDKAIAAVHTELSRAYIAKLIEEENVTVNGKSTKTGYRLRIGDVVDIKIPAPEPMQAVPQDIPLSIVYEDDALLVINKPANMVVHPAAGNFRAFLCISVRSLMNCWLKTNIFRLYFSRMRENQSSRQKVHCRGK